MKKNLNRELADERIKGVFVCSRKLFGNPASQELGLSPFNCENDLPTCLMHGLGQEESAFTLSIPGHRRKNATLDLQDGQRH
jgi:hypothetical protein